MRTVIPVVNQNLTTGHTQGVEIFSAIAPRPDWRITASYSYVDISLDPHGQDLNRGQFLEGATPRHLFGVRSFFDLPAGFQLDGQLRSLSDVRRLPPVATGEGIDGTRSSMCDSPGAAGNRWRSQ